MKLFNDVDRISGFSFTGVFHCRESDGKARRRSTVFGWTAQWAAHALRSLQLLPEKISNCKSDINWYKLYCETFFASMEKIT